MERTIRLIIGLIKKTLIKILLNAILLYKMSQYFPKLLRSFGGNVNLKVDLSNYAMKTDLKM